MNDIQLAKQNFDCRVEIERNLGEPAHKSSKSWAWKCPFHADDTPSFHVYQKGYYCYGCQTHGDIFDWWCFWTKRPLSEVLKENKINLTPEEILHRKVEAAEREIQAAKERIEKAETIIKEIKEGKLWERYHEGLDAEDGRPRTMLEVRGIPEWYQDYRQFGYDPNHRFEFEKGKFFFSPTLAIPFFEPTTWECTNIKHRLLGDSKFKYLPEYKDLPQPLFVTDPAKPIEGKVVLWEGEFKAAVVYVTDPDLNVIGLPGATPSKETLKRLDKCETIWLGLDPDAYVKHERADHTWVSNYESIRDALGRDRVISVELPDKVDDMIVNFGLGRDWLQSNLRQARKA